MFIAENQDTTTALQLSEELRLGLCVRRRIGAATLHPQSFVTAVAHGASLVLVHIFSFPIRFRAPTHWWTLLDEVLICLELSRSLRHQQQLLQDQLWFSFHDRPC